MEEDYDLFDMFISIANRVCENGWNVNDLLMLSIRVVIIWCFLNIIFNQRQTIMNERELMVLTVGLSTLAIIFSLLSFAPDWFLESVFWFLINNQSPTQ